MSAVDRTPVTVVGMSRRFAALICLAASLFCAHTALQSDPTVFARLRVSGDAWAPLHVDDGNAVTWDGCTIRWTQGPMTPDQRQVLRAVMAELTDLTGIMFERAGTSRRIPRTTSGYADGEPVTVPIAWVTRDQTDMLSGNAIGATVTNQGTDGYVSGVVVFDRVFWQQASDGARRALVRHELGHLLGLAHVEDYTSLMRPTLSTYGPHTYSDGDLAGLAVLGRFCTAAGAATP